MAAADLVESVLLEHCYLISISGISKLAAVMDAQMLRNVVPTSQLTSKLVRSPRL